MGGWGGFVSKQDFQWPGLVHRISVAVCQKHHRFCKSQGILLSILIGAALRGVSLWSFLPSSTQEPLTTDARGWTRQKHNRCCKTKQVCLICHINKRFNNEFYSLEKQSRRQVRVSYCLIWALFAVPFLQFCLNFPSAKGSFNDTPPVPKEGAGGFTSERGVRQFRPVDMKAVASQAKHVGAVIKLKLTGTWSLWAAVLSWHPPLQPGSVVPR